jgi:hypothetical protein
MKQINNEDTQLLKRVSESYGGDGLKDVWIEEGMDTGLVTVPTELVDRLIDINTGEEQTFVSHNLIVIGFGFLVAALLKGDVIQGFPLSYWAVGEGEGTFWDALSTSARQAKSVFSLTQLYNETFRKPVGIIFIDSNSDPVSPGPTNRIEVQASFGPDVIGSLREFGVFGGNATTTLNSGLMIDHKAHTLISMNNTPGQSNVLIRALRITL